MISDEKISDLLHHTTPEPPTLLRAETLMNQQDRTPVFDSRTGPATHRVGFSRFAGAVLAAAAVAAVVAGSLAVANRRDTGSTHTRSTAATSSAAPSSPKTPIKGYSTIAATWLPPGTPTIGVSSVGLGARAGRVEYREYTISGNSRTAVVQISLDPRASLPAGPSQGVPWRDLTVGGYAARQWSGATWNWVKILRGRSVVTVELHASRTSAATLEAWARRIAAGLRYDGHELVPAVFGLGQLAGGLHPAEVSASMAAPSLDGHKATLPTTSYTLSRTGALDNVIVMLIPHQSDLAHARINAPGRPVQGRATYTSKPGDMPALRISGAVGGQDLAIFAEFPGARGATMAQLYTIADHLVLHG